MVCYDYDFWLGDLPIVFFGGILLDKIHNCFGFLKLKSLYFIELRNKFIILPFGIFI